MIKDRKILARGIADKLCLFVESIGGSYSKTENGEYMVALPGKEKLCLRPIGSKGGNKNPANSVYLHTAWTEERGRLGGRKANDWYNNPSAGISVLTDDEDELRKAEDFIRCTWDLPPTAILGTRPSVADTSGPPVRVQCVVNRIVRDTAVSQWVKQQHRQTCQVCLTALILPDGTAYSEGHHIRPLGDPHHGPDTAENIICVCPNCHALCDLGAIRMSTEKLRQTDYHVIRQEFIDYHNEKIFAVCWVE